MSFQYYEVRPYASGGGRRAPVARRYVKPRISGDNNGSLSSRPRLSGPDHPRSSALHVASLLCSPMKPGVEDRVREL